MRDWGKQRSEIHQTRTAPNRAERGGGGRDWWPNVFLACPHIIHAALLWLAAGWLDREFL